MRGKILERVAQHAPGGPDQPWESVIAAAERTANARVPGSIQYDDDAGSGSLIVGTISPAAVLIAIIERRPSMSIVLTKRTNSLARHAGQVSFPGGKADPTDGTPTRTALREAKEEVGLPFDRVEIAGRLNNYLVGTGYRITPIVGLVSGDPSLAKNTREVAEIFEIPLKHVLDRANYRHDEVELNGYSRKFHILDYKNYHIWGATAAILVNLREVLDPIC